MSSEMTFLLEKLYQIDKQLGGNAKLITQAKTDEFIILKELIMKNLYTIRKKIQEKTDQFSRNADTIRIEMEIKEILQDSQKQLNNMNESIRKIQNEEGKKLSESEIDQRRKVYENLRQQISDLQEILQQDQNNYSLQSNDGQVETLTDLKSRLLKEGKQVSNKNAPKEMTEDEKEAVERFKQQDKEQDVILDRINDKLKNWKNEADKMNQAIDKTIVQVKGLDVVITKTNSSLDNQNKRLKKIIDEYRKPSKFCMDIILVFVFIGLCAMLYYQLK